MPVRKKLSILVAEIQEAIEAHFEEDYYWIIAEITDVKKYPAKGWCFLKFIEKKGDTIDTEIKGVFWNTSYKAINAFEKLTKQTFSDGIEITCCVKVKFHKRFGLSLEVVDIDANYTIGKLAQDREVVLQQLLMQFPNHISLEDGLYITANNTLPLPIVIKKIALITGANSDGQRDFVQEITNNKYGFLIEIEEYLVNVQGDTAAAQLIRALETINQKKYDVVAMVRGGGSQTDFKPFDDYTLAAKVAQFPIPILTGIGHDRNTSIVDLMAHQLKTPTKVAAFIIDHNFQYAHSLAYYQQRLHNVLTQRVQIEMQNIHILKNRLPEAVSNYIEYKKDTIKSYKRLLSSLSVDSILKKGFAILEYQGNIVTEVQNDLIDTDLHIITDKQKITTTIKHIENNGN